jgi:hypothetical protein
MVRQDTLPFFVKLAVGVERGDRPGGTRSERKEKEGGEFHFFGGVNLILPLGEENS